MRPLRALRPRTFFTPMWTSGPTVTSYHGFGASLLRAATPRPSQTPCTRSSSLHFHVKSSQNVRLRLPRPTRSKSTASGHVIVRATTCLRPLTRSSAVSLPKSAISSTATTRTAMAQRTIAPGYGALRAVSRSAQSVASSRTAMSPMLSSTKRPGCPAMRSAFTGTAKTRSSMSSTCATRAGPFLSLVARFSRTSPTTSPPLGSSGRVRQSRRQSTARKWTHFTRISSRPFSELMDPLEITATARRYVEHSRPRGMNAG
mmetsp:Transcript_1440/g.4328  ORF Transcript_1440/g.4328 Transcript_1440/m.4328 type:complete len:259 (+) Transcript_1440:594-1370(+)